MKKSLFLYLFIIAVLMNVFTYKYFSGKANDEIKSLKKENKKYKDSTLVLYNNYVDEISFSLAGNFRAQNYYEKYNIDELQETVKQALLSYNDSPDGNKYIDQAKIGEQKFIINRLKFLNHRWIMAEYSNGTVWGEVLLKYFINEQGVVSFETIESYLYPVNLN